MYKTKDHSGSLTFLKSSKTHHIDPFSNQRELLENEMISSEELSKIWTEVVDFVRDSQIKCAADLEYLKYGDPTGPVYLQTFTSKKMRRVVEFCNDWLLLGIKNRNL